MITRTAYITQAEYTEVTGLTCSDLEIQEASELISYHTNKRSDHLFESDNPNEEYLNNLKLGTAYQVKYQQENDDLDDGYSDSSNSHTLGRYSESAGKSGEDVTKEWKKISPKTNRYLYLANCMYMGLGTSNYGGGLQ